MSTTTAPALELRLVARQNTYTLDLGGRSAVDFRQHVEGLHQRLVAGGFVTREMYPEPPTVDLVVEVHNTGADETEIWVGGDDSVLKLELVGPGALAAGNGGPFTANICYSEAVKLPSGGHHALPLTQLYHGMRGCGEQWYWTEPGTYTLTARLQLGAKATSPAEVYQSPPAGAVLVSNPVTLEVRV